MAQRQLMRSLLNILMPSLHPRLQGSEVSETVVAEYPSCHVYIVTT